MIGVAHARTFARYSRWQNESLVREADRLTDAERLLPRGAFFSSIQGTLCHLLWADQIWMHRFAATPKPAAGIKDSASLYDDWSMLKRERAAFDEAIVAWADGLSEAWLASDLAWFSGAAGRELTRPRWFLVTHFFNHQTHHRGQVHAMITAAGGKPDDTDIMLMTPEA